MKLGAVIGGLARRVPRRYVEALAVPALRVLAVALRGNAVECPICMRTYCRLLPYGHLEVRTNALCPRCLSLERHRLLWLYLKRRTDFFERQLDVLHIAPERCFLEGFETQHRSGYVTADRESRWARVRVDVQALPFDEDAFDVVLCNHVLEHVDEDQRAMRELFRVLRPQGWAILQSPIDTSRAATYEDPAITTPAGREKAFGQHDHVRVYGLDYAERIANAGFRVTEDDYVRTLSPAEIHRYSLSVEETMFLCRKWADG